MRKWIKISIIFIIVLVLALLIFPLVYKNRIAQFLKQKINNQIHGTLTFKDASLSLIRDFPCISLTLDSLSLDGADTFYGVSLLKVNYIRLGFNLKKLVFSNFKELQLTKLVLERPELNLITTASGLFNLTDLMNKTGSNSDTSSGQSINMRLDNVRITDGTLSYIDASDLMYLTLNHLGLQCKGDYIDNKLTLNQTSEFDSLTYSNESIILLKNVRCTWHGPIEYDLDSSNLKLNRNKISLNSLEMDINGNVQQIKDGTTAIMLDFNAPANDLKQLISLIPGAYQAHFSNLTAAGTFKCEGQINGLFDSNTGEQPKISINSSIENGSVKYSHLPYPIQDIQLRLAIQSLDAFGQYYDFEIPGFSFKIDQEPVSGKLSVIQTKDDASIKGDSKGILSLNTLNKTIPWDSLKMSGRIEFNTQFDFKESQINRKEYNKIKFGGYIRADHVKVNSPLFMPFNVAHANAVLDPSRTTITLDSANYGRTDVAGLINITNPLALVTGNYKTAGISIQSNSNLLDINQIMDYNSINSKPIPPRLTLIRNPLLPNLIFLLIPAQIIYIIKIIRFLQQN